MPIKFACPKCKNVMTVADNMAGKMGKCKCGNQVSVPQPTTSKGAAAAAASPGLAAGFDDLTESDFARQSPYEKIYSPVTSNTDKKTLARFQEKEIEEKKKKAGAAASVLLLISILSLLGGVGSIVLGVMFTTSKDILDKAKTSVPELGLNSGLGMALFIVFGVILIGGAVGLMKRKKWGWFLSALSLAFLAVLRVGSMAVVLKAGFTQSAFFGTMIPVVASLGLCGFIFNGDTQEMFGIKKMVPSILAGLLGIAVAGGIVGLMFSQ